MIKINITNEHREFVKIYSEKQNIGGLSNLSKEDLQKASRLDFQYTGIFGEVSWFMHRDDSIERLKNILDTKFETLRPKRQGDDGFDDSITFNNKTRFVDIKSSFVLSEDKIKHLNLVIPQREFHKNMIYVCAFTVGKTRREIESVILSGWCIENDVHKKWKYDNSKYCVPVQDLRDMKELDEYIK